MNMCAYVYVTVNYTYVYMYMMYIRILLCGVCCQGLEEVVRRSGAGRRRAEGLITARPSCRAPGWPCEGAVLSEHPAPL